MKITKNEWIAFWKELQGQWYHEDSTFPDVTDDQLSDVFEGDSILFWQGDTSQQFRQNPRE